MEEQHIPNDETWKAMEKKERRGKIMGGLLIVAVGILFLARELGAEIPFWVFSWKMLLMGLGLIIAIKHKFLHPGWIVLMAIGGAFLITDIYPELNIKPLLWPSILILIGLAIVFKPRNSEAMKAKYRCRQWRHQHRDFYKAKYGEEYKNRYTEYYKKKYGEDYKGQVADFYNKEEPLNDDYIDSFVFMAGVKKNIVTKNFKGGQVTSVFGGAELDMTQADFEGRANLELTQVFGGTKLIVPANWEIKSELLTVLGSVEDKRPVPSTLSTETPKILVLTGTTVFGGIEIRSY